jgi:Ca2+-binding EF-hand superfamily protein
MLQGMMSIDQLVQDMREKAAKRSFRDVDVLSNLTFLLRRFDLNGNGLIEVDEFRETLKKNFAIVLAKSTSAKLFKRLGQKNFEKNGQISINKLATAIMQVGKKKFDDRFALSISIEDQDKRLKERVDARLAGGIKKQARKQSTHYVEASRSCLPHASVSEILELLAKKISCRAKFDKDLLRMYTNFFRKADLLDQGELTLHQLNDFLRRFFAINLSPRQVKELFVFLDVNGDGAISRVEFIQGFLGHRGFEDKHVCRIAKLRETTCNPLSSRPSTAASISAPSLATKTDTGTNGWRPAPNAFFSKVAEAATSRAASASVQPAQFLREKLVAMDCREAMSMGDIRKLLMDWDINTMSLGRISAALRVAKCFLDDVPGGEYAYTMGKLQLKVVDTGRVLQEVDVQFKFLSSAVQHVGRQSSNLPQLTALPSASSGKGVPRSGAQQSAVLTFSPIAGGRPLPRKMSLQGGNLGLFLSKQ